MLHLSDRRIRQISEARGIGTKIANRWIFRPEEVQALRDARKSR